MNRAIYHLRHLIIVVVISLSLIVACRQTEEPTPNRIPSTAEPTQSAAPINEDVVTEPTEPATSSGEESTKTMAACQANQKSLGGANAVCITLSCGELKDSGFISFSDKVSVQSCSEESLVGACSREASVTYYYEGDAATIKIGCGFAGGDWSVPSE